MLPETTSWQFVCKVRIHLRMGWPYLFADPKSFKRQSSAESLQQAVH
jgi:hypothetical protein